MTSSTPSVLILYFSLSGQTRSLAQRLAMGLREENVIVVEERLTPISPLRFPIGTIPATLKMMIATLFRRRVPIEKLSPSCEGEFDLIILAGPTWSYNPSGPVLSLLDSGGERLFSRRRVIPLISCRGYWRCHWWGLRRLLVRAGAVVPNVIVFSHPCPEPWRTLGVFLKLAGKAPEKHGIIGRYYKRYGHSRDQMEEASRYGRIIGAALQHANGPLEQFSFLSTSTPS